MPQHREQALGYMAPWEGHPEPQAWVPSSSCPSRAQASRPITVLLRRVGCSIGPLAFPVVHSDRPAAG